MSVRERESQRTTPRCAVGTSCTAVDTYAYSTFYTGGRAPMTLADASCLLPVCYNIGHYQVHVCAIS